MANNQYVNKLVWFGETKFDTSADTITADKLLEGFTAHDKSGAPITGTCTFDSDTSEDTAAVAEILAGKTAHATIQRLAAIQSHKAIMMALAQYLLMLRSNRS